MPNLLSPPLDFSLFLISSTFYFDNFSNLRYFILNSPLLKWVRGRFICYELFCSCKPYFPQRLPPHLPVLPGYLYFFFYLSFSSFFSFIFFFFSLFFFHFSFFSFLFLFSYFIPLSFLPSFNIFGRPFRWREERNNK
jgi:hypothetical protein